MSRPGFTSSNRLGGDVPPRKKTAAKKPVYDKAVTRDDHDHEIHQPPIPGADVGAGLARLRSPEGSVVRADPERAERLKSQGWVLA